MPNELMLDFPVLKSKTDDFLKEIVYSVESHYSEGDNKLKITHTLAGQSFIRDLLIAKKANFHVSLYFKDSKERQNFNISCNESKNTNELIAIQHIDVDFSYAPEITPNIIILEDTNIIVNKESGLTDFWELREKLSILKYTRIASCGVLEHSSGDMSKLISPIIDETLPNGAMEVGVSINASESDRAVTVKCARNVYDILDEISLGTKEKHQNSEDSFKLSIISQILCAMYGEIKHQVQNDEITNSGLLAHLEELKNQTGEDWNNDNFNPSLASTKMFPYVTEFKRGE
jgi:hypothetical protein